MPRPIQTLSQYELDRARYDRDLTAYAQQVAAHAADVQRWEAARTQPRFESTAAAPQPPTPPTPPTPPRPPDTYSDRLAKYIPSEVVTLYLALLAAAAQAKSDPTSATWMEKYCGPDWLYWLHLFAFVAGLIATPLTLRFLLNVSRFWHHVICLFSFVIWAVAIPDGLFAGWPPVIRGFLLPLYTFAVAFYRPK